MFRFVKARRRLRRTGNCSGVLSQELCSQLEAKGSRNVSLKGTELSRSPVTLEFGVWPLSPGNSSCDYPAPDTPARPRCTHSNTSQLQTKRTKLTAGNSGFLRRHGLVR